MSEKEIAATLGKKAFADHLGLAPSYVTALIKAGRVVLEGEGRTAKVKVAETMALIESTSAGRFDVARRHAAARLFLSCLSGSDGPLLRHIRTRVFLSCLSGSDVRFERHGLLDDFLSCLSGSDVC